MRGKAKFWCAFDGIFTPPSVHLSELAQHAPVHESADHCTLTFV